MSFRPTIEANRGGRVTALRRNRSLLSPPMGALDGATKTTNPPPSSHDKNAHPWFLTKVLGYRGVPIMEAFGIGTKYSFKESDKSS